LITNWNVTITGSLSVRRRGQRSCEVQEVEKKKKKTTTTIEKRAALLLLVVWFDCEGLFKVVADSTRDCFRSLSQLRSIEQITRCYCEKVAASTATVLIVVEKVNVPTERGLVQTF